MTEFCLSSRNSFMNCKRDNFSIEWNRSSKSYAAVHLIGAWKIVTWHFISKLSMLSLSKAYIANLPCSLNGSILLQRKRWSWSRMKYYLDYANWRLYPRRVELFMWAPFHVCTKRVVLPCTCLTADVPPSSTRRTFTPETILFET